MRTKMDARQVLDQLQRLINSEEFKDSGRSKRLLIFLVLNALGRREVACHPTMIGIELFGRDALSNPLLEELVDDQMAGLDAKLNRYYSSEGLADPVHLSLSAADYRIAVLGGDAAAEHATPPPWLPRLVLDGYDCSGDTPDKTLFCRGMFNEVCLALAGQPEYAWVVPPGSHSLPAPIGVARHPGADLDADFGLSCGLRWSGASLRVSVQLIQRPGAVVRWMDSREFPEPGEDPQATGEAVIAYLIDGLSRGGLSAPPDVVWI